ECVIKIKYSLVGRSLSVDNLKLVDLLEVPENAERRWFQDRGRVFERVLNNLLMQEDMEPRTSMRPTGEEIDGSFALGHSFYLLEAKWHSKPIPASALYAFKGKVDGKLVGTIGVFFSMSDYSKDAVDALLNGKELNLILFGHHDLLLIESGKIAMRDALRIKLRYAADYGQPYYPLESYLSDKTKVETESTSSSIAQVKPWAIITEDETDAKAIEILLSRFDVEQDYHVIPAGGQQPVGQLAEHLVKQGKMNVAVFITPMSNPDTELDRLKQLTSSAVAQIVQVSDVEGWLGAYVSTEYHNATFVLSNLNGKMARRYANNLNLEQLISDDESFSALVKKLKATPKPNN
ncbi:TPA: hypothetical protein ACOL2F_004577, partial [Vibrio parahaemolyticus]